MAQKRLQLIEKVIPKIIEFLMKDDQGFCIANIFVEAHSSKYELTYMKYNTYSGAYPFTFR